MGQHSPFHLRMTPEILAELMRLVEFEAVEHVEQMGTQALVKWLRARGIDCHRDLPRTRVIFLACQASGLDYAVPGDPTIPSLQPVAVPQ